MAFLTKSDYIYDVIKNDIIEGRYNIGERIVVSDVSKKYGISPIPIREAIQRLAQNGYVYVEPHVGARVVHMDYNHLWEIMLIRGQIEPLTAKLAVRDLTEEDIAKLEEYNKEMARCLENNDNERYEEVNREFHSLIYNKCRYKTIRDFTNNLWEQSSLSRTVLLDGNINEESLKDHIEWVEYIKAGDEEKVYELAKKHKERAFRRFQEKYGI